MEHVDAVVHRVRVYLTEPNFADSRTSSWPLIEWQIPCAICLAYLLGIPLGMRLMRDREPFKIKPLATLHNFILFSLSLYMAIECYRQSHINFDWGKTGWRLQCNQNDPKSPDGGKSFSDSGAALARVLYIHYISKAYEFVDTLIMILKKNNRQVSFLHVYHHATTFFPVWWAVMKYGPGGDAWFCCFLNSAIHVGMYGYYLLSTFGVPLRAVKPLITLSQMVQFLGFIYQGGSMLWMDCYRPRVSPVALVLQCSVFFILFTNFFIKAYLMRSSQKPKRA